MSTPISPRIGIYGLDEAPNTKMAGCGLWSAGYAAAVTAAGGDPHALEAPRRGASWEDLLEGLQGVIFLGGYTGTPARGASESVLCESCREAKLPLLGIDHGLHTLNSTFGGTLFVDLPRELPQALQHRHPPEKGVRHAILVERGTRLADLYGEGEVVVNSEHTRAINRLAKGFQVGAKALDGVVEAIETEDDSWFALGVQWQPASTTASGLDIQLFRGLVEACRQRMLEATSTLCSAAA